MNPSVSTRNLIGGLLGGSVGILVSWYFNPLFLPLGVLVGVILGWWYAEIVVMVKDAHQWARKQTGGAVQFVDDSIANLGNMCGLPPLFLRWCQAVIAKAIVGSVWCQAVIAKAIVGSVVWMVKMPGRVWRYATAHPMNLARLIELLCLLPCIAIGVTVGIYLFSGLPHEKNEPTWLFGLILGLLAAIAGASVPEMHEIDILDSMRGYYRRWEIVSHYGFMGFFVYIMARNIRYSIGLVAFGCIIMCWCMPLMIVCLLAGYCIASVLYIVHGFYQLLHRTGHWLCFGVTLAVTTASWLGFNHYIVNEAALWLMALLTGVASGAATEAVRQPILRLYEHTRIGKWLLKPLDEQMGDDDFGELESNAGYIGYTMQLAFFWFTKHPWAQCLRTACLGGIKA